MFRCKHCGEEVDFEMDRGEQICPECGWSQSARTSKRKGWLFESPLVRIPFYIIAGVLAIASGGFLSDFIRRQIVDPSLPSYSQPSARTSTPTMEELLQEPSSSTAEAVSPQIPTFFQPDWESSVQDIIALFDGESPPLKESFPHNGIPTTVIAYNHSELGHRGGVAFSFDQDRLFSVAWTFDEDRQAVVEQYLLAEYGPSEILHGFPGWYDDETVIMMMTTPEVSALYFNYIPIKDERWQRRSALGIVPRQLNVP